VGSDVIDTESSFADVITKLSSHEGKLVVHRVQDTTEYLEANKRQMAEAPTWRPYASVGGKDKAMRKVASIPNIVAEQWMKEGINIFDPSPETQKKVAAKLNSNEYAYLRTYPGRVGYRT
jgi:hypothetical protein